MESAPAPQEEKRLKILVADDERIIADTLAIILEKRGFDVAVVYNGKEAVEKARSWKPDLLLSDVVMPEMSGIDAAVLIREMIPTCRVLLISGQAVTSDLLHDARIGGHNFEVLPKPMHPDELLERLRNLFLS
jgi:CheY-like chemotaxis protein